MNALTSIHAGLTSLNQIAQAQPKPTPDKQDEIRQAAALMSEHKQTERVIDSYVNSAREEPSEASVGLEIKLASADISRHTLYHIHQPSPGHAGNELGQHVDIQV